MDDYPQLKLENQLCFPLYAAHRLVTRSYQPLLDELDLTYPQYLILLVLWDGDGVSLSEIGKRLLLSSNTLTPLLKRLEARGILARNKSAADERQIIITLTPGGRALKERAAEIPAKLMENLGEGFSLEEARALKAGLERLIESIDHQ